MNKVMHSSVARGRAATLLRRFLLGGASTLAVAGLAAPSLAQDSEPAEVIVVTGVRASLERAMDVKRNADGVVDAISAEDIGKFPDTNLAESLQRITGVSINRVNGEGSLITSRGFGADFNLVTLNGRQMPTANIATIGGGDGADFATGTSRQFDFSNIAAEGVRGLEVYKTGRASLPTGGIGATVNILTFRPLDTGEGFNATIGAKALHDTTVVNGDEITPELSTLLSWADPDERFGVSLFGSWQQRHSASAGAVSNAWNIMTGDEFLSATGTLLRAGATVNNPPGPDQLIALPNDSRYIFAEDERERLNGNLTLQFAPTSELMFTADAFYAENDQVTQRAEQTNWFNRPFDEVTFSDDAVATTVFLFEDIGGSADVPPALRSVKDMGYEQQYRSSLETLTSFGINGEWIGDNGWSAEADIHSSRAWSGPSSSNNTTSTLVSIGAPVVAAHSLDLRSGFPVQRVTIDDLTRGPGQPNVPAGFGTNVNGALDVGDLGSQVGRTNSARTTNLINQAQFKVGYDFDDTARIEVGVDYRDTEFTRANAGSTQTLGDWGIGNPGDVALIAPGLVETYCLSCQFNDFTPGDAQIAFRANAIDLYNALSAAYLDPNSAVNPNAGDDSNPISWNSVHNVVTEEILAFYGQIAWEGEFGGLPADLLVGVRYEDTEVTATSLVDIPQQILWLADNDTITQFSGIFESGSADASYDHVLPSVDFSLEFLPDVIGRVSFSETIARANFANLFFADQVGLNNPLNRPTALGGEAIGNSNNPGLLPLQSQNLDFSLEWYFDEASYVSVGLFDKRVRNFIGNGVTVRNLYGLRDPTSDAAGTRSRAALDLLQELQLERSDVNHFTATALIDQFGVDQARTMLLANIANGQISQSFVDQTLAAFDVAPDANDPLLLFAVNGPVNNREGKIHGLEFAFQHFFGDSGFGIQANYTLVEGDVDADVTAPPGVNQFALLGLSDTANATLIYENYGISARLSYNWRDEFLALTNDDGTNNNPLFVAPFEEVDVNISYDISDNIQVSFEGINLLGEDLETYSRSKAAFVQFQELGPRYLIGARYKF